MKRKDIIIVIVTIAILIILDYLNILSLLGLKMSNINIDFWIGILNIIVIIVLYKITYKKIDEKSIERENNKHSISILLLQEVYRECKSYVELLEQDIVEKYIVPKIDFNSTDIKNSIISNLQSAPFLSENTILDFIKDGQITKTQIEGYFRVKKEYRQYIYMRIAFYDVSQIYESLKTELDNVIAFEIEKLDTKIKKSFSDLT